MLDIKKLRPDDISARMLSAFRHQQRIVQKYVRQSHGWDVLPADEVRAWSDGKRLWIPQYLREQASAGGTVLAAYSDGTLIGFASVDGFLRGESAVYANLTMLFVDDAWQGRGIGRRLFCGICGAARSMGAERLFISAIPSVPTVTFYCRMGCTDAAEVIAEFVDTSEDRYLEYVL